MREAVNVVILGGGSAGWTAAAGLSSLIGQNRCEIRLIESDEIGIVGVGEATLPHIKSFNDSIGLDETEVMRRTKATFKLGIEFIDWGFKGSSYIHPFGIHGPATQGLAFHHQWLRAKQSGWDSDIEEYSFAVMAARDNRFDFPPDNGNAINSTYSYAYHLDANLYAPFLREFAEARGVTRTEGKVKAVNLDPESGDVASLQLESGEVIDGDFFIDCSGFRSMIIGGALGVEWEDWAHWLPCDRAWAVPTENHGELTPFTRLTAMEAGWRWRIPLQHRCGNGHVFSSSFIEEGEAAEALLRTVDAPPLADPRLLKFRAGRRKKSWHRNCLALGLASGFLEPLESTSMYLFQIAVMHLLPIFPEKRIDPLLADEFNRKMDLEYERIRDFLILHYHLTSRDDSELWKHVRHMDVPDSLKRKMHLFEHRGYIEGYRDGLFYPPSWLSVYVGQGMMPAHYHPLADNRPVDAIISDLDDLRTEIRDRVGEMPKHSSFLSRYAPAEAA